MKIKNKIILLLHCLIGLTAAAQMPYTFNNYNSFKSDSNVVYGISTGFDGKNDTLLLDIYKPAGNVNCKRPLITLVHGGAWITGSKNDASMINTAQFFAKCGWIAATINYRLGTHKNNSYVQYPFCGSGVVDPCMYNYDTAEVVRANYRGMQDAKGAIRFMKNRFILDSSDITNVFIAGESAGGFVSIAAAYTDISSEKPAACGAISTALAPDPDLAYCVPPGYSLTRPDLGDKDGSLNLGIHDASVKGVGSFYGGVMDTLIFQQVAAKPIVYLFHQGSDIIVNYNKGELLGRLNQECIAPNNLCQPITNTHFAYGGEGVRQIFVNAGSAAPTYTADIISNYNYGNNCFSNGHSTDDANLRLQHLISFFAQSVISSGNTGNGNCLPAGIENYNADVKDISVYPNPFTDIIEFAGIKPQCNYYFKIMDLFGKNVLTGELPKKNMLNLAGLDAGIYIAELQCEQGCKVLKITKR